MKRKRYESLLERLVKNLGFLSTGWSAGIKGPLMDDEDNQFLTHLETVLGKSEGKNT